MRSAEGTWFQAVSSNGHRRSVTSVAAARLDVVPIPPSGDACPAAISAVQDYLHVVQRSARLGKEERALPGDRVVRSDAARCFRLEVTEASRRLPAGSLVAAAHGGLQDSAPRAALLSLSARVHRVSRDDWEHEDFTQIWFRWADYVVPSADVAVFTIGTLPRRAQWRDALHMVADDVAALAPLGRAPSREITQRLPMLVVRATSTTGRVRIRWDARTVDVILTQPPRCDPEEARLELARRFVHWQAPTSVAHFAKWAAVTAADARETWRGLADELTPIAFGGRRRWCLHADLARLVDAARPDAVRFLPQGDPVRFMADVFTATSPVGAAPRNGVTTRLVNSLTGLVVLDGEAVASWGRVRGNVTVLPHRSLAGSNLSRVQAEAAIVAATVGFPLRFRLLDASF